MKAEGDTCFIDECTGVIELKEVENCSCHINPPCIQCVENPLRCSECMTEVMKDKFGKVIEVGDRVQLHFFNHTFAKGKVIEFTFNQEYEYAVVLIEGSYQKESWLPEKVEIINER